MFLLLRRFVPLSVLLCAAWCSAAEPLLPIPAPPVIPATGLRPLTMPSGYIFAGTVTAVRSILPHNAGEIATVEVTFHVDHGVRGVQTGRTLTIREWMGVWEFGQRYRKGEKVFLFLYRPSKLGLTSVVGGTQGRFPIQGRVVGVDPVRFPGWPVVNGGKPLSRNKITVSLDDFEHSIRLAAERTKP